MQKQGNFVPFEDWQAVQGFVVTYFEGDRGFCFQESETDARFSWELNHPVVVNKSEYLGTADRFIERIREQNLGKAIFSRIHKESFNADPEVFFEALCESYPSAFVYLISSPFFGIWIGASPEKLLEVHADRCHTMALAGTRKVSDAIPWGEKEFEEHEFVADFIAEQLKTNGATKIQRSERKTVISGAVSHLRTDFDFDLPLENRVGLIQRLHPTPAVSGFPREEALQLIRESESHARALYAGIIGILDEDIELFVNLRCAQVTQGEMFLYLGGGFTKDSDSELEWTETENKAQTLLNVAKNL